jgi:hypothetical protein
VRTILRARNHSSIAATTEIRTQDRTRQARQTAQDHRPSAPTCRSTSPPSGRRTSARRRDADGWLPIFFSPTGSPRRTAPRSTPASPKRERPNRADFDIAPSVTVLVGDDVDALRGFVKPVTALYVGGMGARGRNFYNDLACRFGYEAAAKEIQDLYLDGKKQEATAAVPDELVDEIALVGPKERIAERLEPWREAGVSTMIVLDNSPARSASWPSSRSEREEANARTQRDPHVGKAACRAAQKSCASAAAPEGRVLLPRDSRRARERIRKSSSAPPTPAASRWRCRPASSAPATPEPRSRPRRGPSRAR